VECTVDNALSVVHSTWWWSYNWAETCRWIYNQA